MTRARTHLAEPAERIAPAAPRPLRLAVVIPSLNLGGAERYACDLARRLNGGGAEVTVVTWWPQSDDVLQLPPGLARIALDVGRVSRNVLHSVGLAAWRTVALRRAFRDLRPDVIVSFLHHTNEVSILAASGTGIPVFVCERSDPRHDQVTRHWSLARRVLYPRAAGVIVQTQSVGDWARAFCTRVHVIPNHVERPRQLARPDSDEGALRVVAMGRLSPEKGFDLLIDAFARIAGRFPAWSLSIFGEGPARRQLERAAAERGLSDRVSLPGRTLQPEVELAAAHAFALPSRYEGFPNALIEAMACGLPVVAFDCQSGPAEIVSHGHDGLLVPAGDVAAFAEALATVFGSPVERARLGRNATDIAVRLAPGPILDRWSAVLASVERR